MGSLGLAAVYRDLTWSRFVKALRGTMMITVMMLTIMAGAIGFSQLLAYTGASRGLLEFVTSFDVSPMLLVILMQLVVLVLGCFMEQIAIMLITLPIFMPILKVAGIDPVWFAVITLISLEVGLMTPPFGLLLFVMKGAVPTVPMDAIWRAAVPFILIDIFAIGLLIVVPDIAMGLTRYVR
jgi:TRAP-type C4-dicarboxylate transport system permease large subunit